MEAYTIRGMRVEKGIPVAEDGFIHVGEKGRGRRMVRVPVPVGSTVEVCEPPKEDRLVDVPGEGILLFIPNQSGYRGAWRLAEYATGECPERRVQVDVRNWRATDRCPGCGRLIAECWRPDLHAPVPAGTLQPEDIGVVVAKGHCAQGEAGRMGGGPEYLIVVKPGTKFSIRRSGRLYGSPPIVNVVIAEDLTVTATDAWSEITEDENDQ